MLHNFIEHIKSLTELALGLKVLIVLGISALPIIELRGALPVASALGLDWYLAFPLAFLGNILPVPFILLFINKIFDFLRPRGGLGKLVRWLEKKADKHKGAIEKYGVWGLILFVGIPLPGTGAWTGALIAALMRLKFRPSLMCCAIGVAIAGVILIIISYVIPHFVGQAVNGNTAASPMAILLGVC